MRPTPRRAASLAAATLLALGLTPAPAPAAPDPAGAATPYPSAAGATEVALVTGDRVILHPGGGMVIEPAARASGAVPVFQTTVEEDPAGPDREAQVYVLPSDALPLVPDVLDRELFNVTKLARYGDPDRIPGSPATASETIPVIMSRPEGGPAPLAAAPGLAVTAELASIDGYAARIDTGGRWWRSVAPPGPAARAAGTAGATTRIWLDELVEAALDRSVPQVGAPEAWAAGYDGAGVTVAVLDTGIDADHADLAGKVVAAENFSASGTVTDRVGHGTHVAGTVAGTGEASGGRYTGVAPGADLMNGKVLDDGGRGLVTDIIAGMEWAVANGADLVSMSLGSDLPSDGTDRLSLAVNQLTAAHEVLFVIAAGNFPPGERTVASPGAADAALTVGAVDRDEALAGFSGRGPRLGDFAIKPDLTAPGVDIVSARAEGTTPGPIVDERYTVISGTSMATPHVAGAAAILLQREPGLAPAELKAALAGTAAPHPELDVYQQGGGRLDVPAALAAPVRATPTPLNLGYLSHPDDQTGPVSAEVTYTNRTDAPVTLDLALSLALREPGGGGPPPPGPLAEDGFGTVAPETLTVPAGGTATATVTVDPRLGGPGTYGGTLVAGVDGAPAARTPVGVHLEPESHLLTIEGIARDGRPAGGRFNPLQVKNVDDSTRFLRSITLGGKGPSQLRVPAGTYSVLGVISTYDEELRWEQELTFVGAPEVEVTGDTTVVLDAREAVPVSVETPAHPDAAPIEWAQHVHWRQPAAGPAFAVFYTGPTIPMYATPTEPVTIGDFEYISRHLIGEPEVALRVIDPDEPLDPWLMTDSPAVTGDSALPLVDAGLGTPEDYQGLDVTGAIVLTGRGGPDAAAKEAAARAAGAAALLVSNDHGGNFRAFVSDDASIPALTLSRAAGGRLRDLLAAGAVNLRLSGQPDSGYRYDVTLPEPGTVPSSLDYRLDPAQLATVDGRYHQDVAGQRFSDTRFFFRPWAEYAVVHGSGGVPGQSTRTDFLVPGDTRYQQLVSRPGVSAGALYEQLTSYRAGERRTQSWAAPVSRPGRFGDFAFEPPTPPAFREGDRLVFPITEWVDGHGNFSNGPADIDASTARLYADGTLVGELDRAGAIFEVGPDPARYRYVVEVTRDAPWWQTATATRTAWTFQSGTSPEVAVLPLLEVDYLVPADLANVVAGRAPVVDLRVGHQPGATGTVTVSYDDGATWQDADLAPGADPGRWRATLPPPPPGEGFATLRMEAADADGNLFTQEVVRAWRYQAPACDRVVTGRHVGPLSVTGGTTCLDPGARVFGPVRVAPGAGIVVTRATVTGPVSANGAARVELRDSTVTGSVSVTGTSENLVIAGNHVTGPVRLVGNDTAPTPIVVGGNHITGPLACTHNSPPPVTGESPNVVTGPTTGQCADL